MFFIIFFKKINEKILIQVLKQSSVGQIYKLAIKLLGFILYYLKSEFHHF